MDHGRRSALRRAVSGLGGVRIPLLCYNEGADEVQTGRLSSNVTARRTMFGSWFKSSTSEPGATSSQRTTNRLALATSAATGGMPPVAQPAKLYNGLLRQDPRGRIGIMAPCLSEDLLPSLVSHFSRLHPELPVSPSLHVLLYSELTTVHA